MIAWLLLVLVMLRAAIPVGFMPDLNALQDGRIEIVVCTPAGLKTMAIAVDKAGPDGPQDAPSNRSASQECPFDTVLSQALIVPTTSLVARSLDTGPDLSQQANTGSVPTLLLGPPLGSRAPPSLTL